MLTLDSITDLSVGKAKEVPAGKKARVLHCSSSASFSFLWYKGNKKLCFSVSRAFWGLR